ncbi:MAG: hypothetical protein HY696_08890 [Deltaproteobacteria bacterium]|nr:hypothetical protein [Deltaproteobacteria bacterium]
MTRRLPNGWWWCVLLLCTACGRVTSLQGGTETGNPDTGERAVTGEVTSGDAAADESTMTEAKGVRFGMTDRVGGACVADTVRVINSRGLQKEVEIDTDCSFTVSLPVRKAYLFRFLKNAIPVGHLFVPRVNDAYSSYVAVVAASVSPLALGRITIAQGLARAQYDPDAQNDLDGDGESDDEDDDDDGDGISDEDEDDCDLDGIPGELDEETDSCDATDVAGTVPVLRVKPRNTTLFELVSLRETVGALVACTIDEASLTTETFRVESADGVVIDCQLRVHESGSGVVCRHDNDPFAALTVYTATLAGVACTNGSVVQTRSWSWRTEED